MKKFVGLWFGLVIGLTALAAEEFVELSPAASVESVVESAEIGVLHDDFISTFLPIIPPNPSEMFLQPVEQWVALDESGFNRRFLRRLVGEMHPVSGAPVYTVYTMQDASDSSVVIFNENLKELARIPWAKAFDPYSWAESKFGATLTSELMALYNPARMIAEYRLIPANYVDYHITALEQQAALTSGLESERMVATRDDGAVSVRVAAIPPDTVGPLDAEEPAMGMMTMSMPLPPGDGDGGGSGSGGSSTNQIVELAFTMPVDCGPYVEIFRKQNLIYPQYWEVAVDRMAVTGGVEIVWADPISSNAPTMFYIVNDTSSGADDGDAYSELRERYVEGTNPHEFTFRDNDADGLNDWYETMLFGAFPRLGRAILMPTDC